MKPWLTPLAAAGLVVIMALATAFHLVRGEAQVIAFNLVPAVFVARGWWTRARIAPRS